MSSQYDRLKKNALAKAQQNRINRVSNTNKKYKNDISKSQKAYIAGDLFSSASGKAYGYKQYGMPEQSWITGGRSRSNYKKLQEGKNPYETKYVYDGKSRTVTTKDGNTFTSRKRYLTDDEKKALKHTGSIDVNNYKKNYKFSWLDGVDSDGKTFESNLNWRDKDGKIKWDGMNVAKNKVKAGGSKFNYLGGFLKDIVVDPGVDFLKQFDRFESGAMGAGLGALETASQVGRSLGTKDFSFKDVDWSRAKTNFSESLEHANKTGWGKSAIDYLNESYERNKDGNYEYNLKTRGKEFADKYLENEEKYEGLRKGVNFVGGLGLDFFNPAQFGTAFAKGLKFVSGNTLKAGKAMLNGTSDVNVAFRVDPLKTQEMIEKFANRVGKSSGKGEDVLDVLTNQGKVNEGVLGNSLNKQFDYAMNKAENVKEVVKANPKTQNLGSFLDEIGENISKGTQRNIDGRTLNKKYTQTKDGYVPQTLRGEEVVDDVAKNGQIDGQLNLLDELDRISQPSSVVKKSDEEIYFNTIARFSDDVDSILKDIDDMPVEQADRFYDWVEKTNPELFYKLTDGVSLDAEKEVSKLIESQTLPKNFNKNYLTNPIKKNKEDIFNSSIEQNKNLVNQYDEFNKSRLLQDDVKITPRKTYNELKEDFVNYGNNIKEQLKNGDTTFINKLQEVLPKINYNKLAKDNNYRVEVINKLNKELFGTDYIRQNVKSRNLKPFLEHLEDIMNYNLTKQQGLYSFKPKGTYSGTKKGVHYMYDRNGVPNDINLNSSFFSPSIIDSNFEDKMNHVNKLVGVEFKSELTEPFKKLKELAMKQGEKLLSAKDKELAQSVKKGTSSDSVKAYLDNKKLELGLSKLSPEQQKQYKSLESRIKIRDEAYEQIKHMDEQEWLDFMSKNDKSYNEAVKEASINSKDFKPAQTKEQMYSPDGDFKNSSSGEISVTHGKTEAGVAQYEEAFKTKMLTDLKLESPYYKDFEKLPKGKKLNFVEFSRHKQGRKVLKNIRKLTDKLIETESKYGKQYTQSSSLEARVIREEMKDIISNLKRYGIDESIWKKQLDDYVEFKKKASVNANKEVISPLEKAGLSINNKRGAIGSKNNPKFMEEIYLENKFKDNFFIDEYENALNSVSPKDLLNSNHKPRYEGEVASHGDNIGEKLSDEWQTLTDRNINSIESLQRRSKKFTNRVDVSNHTPYDYDEFAGGEDILGDFWNNINKKDNPLDKVVKETSDDFNPFNTIKGGVDDISDVAPEVKKVRRKKTQTEIDEINKKIKSFEERQNNTTPLEKVGDNRRLPRVSELMEQGVLKDDAFKIIEKMKKGEIELPSFETIKKADRQGGFNTTTQINASELEKILSKINNTSPANTVKNVSKPKSKPKTKKKSTSDIKYGQHNVNKSIPKGYILNESTGELEKLTDHLLSNKVKPDASVYDVKEVVSPSEIVKPKTFKPGEGKRKFTDKNKHSFEKEGKEIELPKQYVVNEQTGEIEDLTKHLLGRNIKPDSDVYEALGDVEGKISKSQLDEIIDEIGASKEGLPTFEKFKKFFTEKSDNAQIGYEEDAIYKAYKAWLNTWKKGLTIYNPGWHVANFLQNKGQNYLALGGKAFGSQKNARNVLAHINGKDKGAFELVTKNGTKYTKEELANLAKEYGIAEGMGTNASKSHGVFPWLETKIDNSSLMQGALQSEQTARLHHFLTQLERGKTPEQAVKSVNDYLFDYGSKTKADKLMSDFVDPFWSFHKNNAKMLLKAPYKNTSNVNNILRANRDLDNVVNEDDRRSNDYREHQLPFGAFKDEINGDEYTYHYDEHVLPDIDKALPLERDDLENKLNPIIRLALQQSRGEGNFGNKITDKSEADYDEVTKDDRLKEIVRELNPIMNPLFKAFNESDRHQKKADKGTQSQETSNKQILNTWLAYILGNKGNYYRNRE